MHFDKDVIRRVLTACNPHQELIANQFWRQIQSKKIGSHLISQEQQTNLAYHLFNSLNAWAEYAENPNLLKQVISHHRQSYQKYGMNKGHFQGIAKTLNATLVYFFEDQWTPYVEEQWNIFSQMILNTLNSDDATMGKINDLEMAEFSRFDVAGEEIKEYFRPMVTDLIQQELQKQIAWLSPNSNATLQARLKYDQNEMVRDSGFTFPVLKARSFDGR